MEISSISIDVAGSNCPALVSPGDAELVSGFKWHLEKRTNSAGVLVAKRVRANDYSSGKHRMISLHRLILRFPSTLVDHISGDVLDNRRENLRTATVQGNRANSQQNAGRRFKGISVYSHGIEAQIFVGGRKIHLGTHDTEEDAARIYDAAARIAFGEFARLNFPNWRLVELPENYHRKILAVPNLPSLPNTLA